MRLALDLAARGRTTARPNPMVGAVVVKDGRIVGSGYHERPGSGHAEVNALAGVSDEEARGSTVYVTLEPCSFTGRTPPCADLLVERNVARVVCAIEDPDARVSGQGFARLREAGIQVDVGPLAADAERLNAAYLTHRRCGRPIVTLKIAQSLDGSTGLLSGASKWITGPAARRRGHALRAEHQAIAVGIGTVLADDPALTVRHVDGDDPVKVVFDTELRVPDAAQVLDGAPCIVCASATADEERGKALEARGVEVWRFDGRPKPDEVVRRLAERDVISLLIEGGRKLATSFLKARCVDRVAAFSAPILLGGVPALGDLGFADVAEGVRLADTEVERVGADVLVTGSVRY